MSGRASIVSMMSSQFGVCHRRGQTVRADSSSRLKPRAWRRRGGEPQREESRTASVYLTRLRSGVDVVAAPLEIEGVDSEPSFGFFHLLGEEEGEAPSPIAREEKKNDDRGQTEKIPSVT